MTTQSSRRVALLTALSFLIVGSAAVISSAQFGRIGDAAEKLKKKTPGVSSLLEGKPPITTSLSDAKFGVESMDGTNPASFSPFQSLERTAGGGFVLKAGYYRMQTQSYCLKAGTHGPGAGDGYLYGPTKGPAEEAVMTIVRNSVRYSEIPQHDIQMLLWAIIARAKFEELSPTLKATAARLLTPQQLATLNRSGLDAVPDSVLQRALGEAPAGVRQALQAEADLRRMLTSPSSTFADMERVAVLAGAAPIGEGSRSVPSGRWSLHPDGYYVRYLPSGYSSTRLEIWVPDTSKAIGREYDPATHVAVPGNTARQRIIQSGRVHP